MERQIVLILLQYGRSSTKLLMFSRGMIQNAAEQFRLVGTYILDSVHCRIVLTFLNPL